MNEHIIIKGAREHNLKNVNLKIPKGKFIIITGLSGSGKSSLAFDTIYAEGQRRYVESLSSYARQFLGQLEKPDVEHIEGLSPAIAIEQRGANTSPRSVVATQTEIYDYLRLLFARIGKPHCYLCKRPVTRQTSQEIIDKILSFPQGRKISILAPVVRGGKGTHEALFDRLLKEGFVRVRVNGQIYELGEKIVLGKYKQHNIEVVVDRIEVAAAQRKRIADSVEIALRHSGAYVLVFDYNTAQEHLFTTQLNCAYCDVSLGEMEPRMFSFNSPYGACPDCNGLGIKLEFDPDLIIPDKTKTIREGAIAAWRKGSRGYMMYYRALQKELMRELGSSLDIPFKKISVNLRKKILYGDVNTYVWGKTFEGVIPNLERVFNSTESDWRKAEISKYMAKLPCPRCSGQRLKKESLSVYLAQMSIWDITKLSISECVQFFKTLKLSDNEEKIANYIIQEINKRLHFCVNVGLSYLTLDRLSSSLSGGEAQRIRLATQLGSSLSGVLYIMDEPTIGLHPRDDQKLISTILKLKNLGNTVIVVEHDEQMIAAGDWIVDLGPGAGNKGGRIVYSGPKKGLLASGTLTAKYLNNQQKIDLPLTRRKYQGKLALLIKGAQEHNLKNINVRIPLEVFICVTGVSGSGKSTLVEDILYNTLAKFLYGSRNKPGKVKKIEGLENIDKVIIVDQSPIGRTPRSNPATYTGVFTYIREVFSSLAESKIRGYRPARFSFNVAGGRCEACRGEGTKKIEMHFLPDVYIPCEVCHGKRFNKQTQEIKFKGKSISDILKLDIDRVYELFINFPRIKNILQTLKDVGLGYVALGQFATTLSGGEAQRMKLASQLRKKATGKTLYIFDEPTTGLHFDDIRKLLLALQRLVDKKNTVLIIEHNLDVIKCADYIIDLGPEGGEQGGRVIACGTPEEIVSVSDSYTGKFLKRKL